jgi:hypothetical protein
MIFICPVRCNSKIRCSIEPCPSHPTGNYPEEIKAEFREEKDIVYKGACIYAGAIVLIFLNDNKCLTILIPILLRIRFIHVKCSH